MAILEICANSFHSALNAERGGAHRIELCQNLEAGGTTPSFGLIRKVKQNLTIPVCVLIRPRTGDFTYSDEEFEIMLEDIRACRDLGCDGVVVGVLTKDSCVDVLRVSQLVRAAKSMPVTFHRAFDDCRDQLQALEDVLCSGCVTILTSGGAESAVAGSLQIARLVERAAGRLVVMPGAGVTADNLGALAMSTAATEFHASAKTITNSPFESRFAATQLKTDFDQVKALAAVVARLSTTKS